MSRTIVYSFQGKLKQYNVHICNFVFFVFCQSKLAKSTGTSNLTWNFRLRVTVRLYYFCRDLFVVFIYFITELTINREDGWHESYFPADIQSVHQLWTTTCRSQLFVSVRLVHTYNTSIPAQEKACVNHTYGSACTCACIVPVHMYFFLCLCLHVYACTYTYACGICVNQPVGPIGWVYTKGEGGGGVGGLGQGLYMEELTYREYVCTESYLHLETCQNEGW